MNITKDSEKVICYIYKGNFDILDSTIVYMESRFKNGLSDVLDLISKFIP